MLSRSSRPSAGLATQLALVALGGAVGTGLRLALGAAVPDLGGLPLGMLAANLLGALLLGALLAWPGIAGGRGERPRLLLGTGLLGGFTTMSALAVAGAELARSGDPIGGLVLPLATVLLATAASLLGIALGGRLAPRGRP